MLLRQRAYVTIKGKQFIIGEGYVQESSISSVGPQQILAKIKNEIKAGNPVKWSWRAAAGFKKKAKPAEPVAATGDSAKAAEGKTSKPGDKKEASFFGIKIPKQLGANVNQDAESIWPTRPHGTLQFSLPARLSECVAVTPPSLQHSRLFRPSLSIRVVLAADCGFAAATVADQVRANAVAQASVARENATAQFGGRMAADSRSF
eukprot:3938343-Rhodomonas_salina.1